MSKKTILILGKLPPPYMGPSIATNILLNSELKNTFNLVHLDTKINASISSFGKWNFKKLFKNISIYLKMLKLLVKYKPNIVLIPISQTTMGFVKDSVFIIFAAIFRSKIIIQLRGSDIQNWLSHSFLLTRLYFKFILKCTKGVIVLGNNLKYLFRNYFADDAIFVIANGGNYAIPHVDKSQNTQTQLLYFSNLLKSKGVEDVFKAISILNKLPELKNSFSINFVGAWNNNDLQKSCIQLIETEKLPITIYAPTSGIDKFNFFANADIFIFPPQEPEGHPWAIVEAMAASLPIISTNQGAIIESVIDGENGFIVEPKNPEAIARKLKLLIQDKILRQKMANESHQLYLANFTEEKMIEKYTQLFNKI